MNGDGLRGRGVTLALVFLAAAGAAWVILTWFSEDSEGVGRPAPVTKRPAAPPDGGTERDPDARPVPPKAGPAPEVVPAAAPDAEPETWEPRWERGLALRLEPRVAGEGAPDTRRARMPSLHVERGSSPSPFLKPGPFRATWTGRLPVPLRDRYRFQALGKGRLRIEINAEPVLEGRLGGEKPIESEAVRLRKGDNDVRVVFESELRGDGTLRVYWSSTAFTWEPIAPELWQHDAAAPDMVRGELLRRGRALIAERRCARCHLPDEPLGGDAMPELSRSGPDLRDVGARVRSGFLRSWLEDPRAVRPDARMPRMPWTNPQRDPADVAAFLASQGEPPSATDPPSPVMVEEGEARFYELGCVACHVAPAAPVEDTALGDRIHLGFAASKWRAPALADYLREPSSHHPHVRMPDLKLDEADATALAAFLLAGSPPDGGTFEGDAARGARLVASMGCARCHETGVADESAFAPLSALAPERGCLAAAPAAPDHDLSAEERVALAAFLGTDRASLHRAVPAELALRAVHELRCTACHAFDGEASTWNLVAARMWEAEPLPEEMDPVVQGVPSLTWAGGKLQPEWMVGFVTGELESPRPWLTARMPAFEEYGEAVVTGLVHQHGYPVAAVPEEKPDPVLAEHGRRLVQMGEGFGCVQCHGIGDRPPVQVFERQGVNFARVAGRLRKEYYTRWLADPPRIDPDSRMPRYADDRGKTAFTDMLDGDAARQFEAIWHYLLTLR